MSGPLLSVEDLTVRFATDEGLVTAVEGVSFELRAGEILGLVGESGSGKSVTAKSIMRLNAGNARYGDETSIIVRTPERTVDVMALRREREMRPVRGDRVSMIFQEPMASFAPAITIGKQMIEQLQLHRRVSRKEAREIGIAMLSQVGIAEPAQRFDQYAFELSGGMRQRAMIAMALSTRPQLLIADEPTTALDVTIQAQVLELIRNLVAEYGMGVILITHDLGVVAQTCDRVAVLYLGRLVETGPVRDVLRHPQHPYTRGLIHALPRLDDLDAPLTPVPGDIPSPLERPRGCVFHTRCAEKIAGRCELSVPAFTALDARRRVACFAAHDRVAAEVAAS